MPFNKLQHTSIGGYCPAPKTNIGRQLRAIHIYLLLLYTDSNE